MKGGVILIGKKFGKLLVLSECDKYKYKCLCDCGNTSIVSKYNLTSGHTKSCGCLSKNNASTHRKSNTRLYHIYSNMLARCYNKHYKRYNNWGGRGITMCDEWKNDFMSFYNWAINNGYNDTLTIDRINNDGNYEPSNCRWTTVKQQGRNRRTCIYFTHNDETRCILEWCEILGLKPKTVYQRINYYNWTIERALGLESEVVKHAES